MGGKKGGKELYIGGQAVIEGVMMRTRDTFTIAVRKPNKKITVQKTKFLSATRKKPWNLPFLRGIIVLFETIYLGMKALTWSGNQAAGAEDVELSKFEIGVTVAVSLLLALVIFKLLPLGIANIVPTGSSNLLFNLIDGFSKIIILAIYVWAISLMGDVKRLFQYHGAEHMAVHCYEAKKKLTVANVKKYPKEHQRCGTAFILVVLILSILFYLFIPFSYSFWSKYLIRILLLPIIAGVSYEVIRLAGKHKKSAFFTAISMPGVWMQKLTTKDPEDDMIEVAIKSLKAAVS